VYHKEGWVKEKGPAQGGLQSNPLRTTEFWGKRGGLKKPSQMTREGSKNRTSLPGEKTWTGNESKTPTTEE